MITRQQLLAGGYTLSAIRAKIESGRWRPLSRGVYCTFSGPPTRPAVLWAAVLAAGSGAVLSRQRVRWRRPLAAALADVATGCHSLLELRYLRDVERAHGLPVGQRQFRRGATYSDVEYGACRLNVELDGRIPHQGDGALRDWRRDNRRVADGLRVMRYGYGDISTRPCAAAREVADALVAGGWTGKPKRCGPQCQLAPT